MTKITAKHPAFAPPVRADARPVAAPAVPTAKGWNSRSGFEPTAGATPATEAKLAEIRKLMVGHTDRAEEKRVTELFRGTDRAELNELIAELPLAEFHALVGDMDDRLFGPDNRGAFLSLLTKDRVGDLDVASKAKLIGALQTHRTGSGDEKAIRDLFLATKGGDLSELKKAVDHGGDHRDLQQLIFHDLDDSKIRAALLKHFAAEGTTKNGQVKVLSDIDDTFYANLKDDRYPKKTVYPGVKDFYAELDPGNDDLMFLSARPYDRPGASEHLSRGTIEGAGVKDPTILSGDWAHLVGNHLIADKKFDNWAQVRQLYPEYGSVFVGDSGQGDAIFGAKAAALPGTDMKRVFIHNVTHLDAAARADFAAKGVAIFDTYVGAATDAFKAGLMPRDGLLRVAAAAERELAAIVFSTPEQKAAREAELARDLDAMRAALQ